MKHTLNEDETGVVVFARKHRPTNFEDNSGLPHRMNLLKTADEIIPVIVSSQNSETNISNFFHKLVQSQDVRKRVPKKDLIFYINS